MIDIYQIMQWQGHGGGRDMAMQKVQTPSVSPPRPLARVMDSFVPLPAPEEVALRMNRMSIRHAMTTGFTV